MAMNIYLFGDQTGSVEQRLQALLHQDNAIVREFLHQAFQAVQAQLATLPLGERDGSLTKAETLGLLIEAASGKCTVALTSAFWCMYQVGYYLHGRQHPPTSGCALGLCTGAIAAAAVSCSQTIFDIPRLGAQATVVAFRVGVGVQRRGNALDDAPGPWSVIVAGIDDEEAEQRLQALASRRKIETPSLRPYISAVAPNSVTISGAPSMLETLTDVFADKKRFSAPIYGPYHQDGYTSADLERHMVWAMQDVSVDAPAPAQIPFMCCASGSVSANTTFGDLLQLSVVNILAKKMRIDKAITSLNELIANKHTTVIPIGAQTGQSFVSSLSQNGSTVRLDTDTPPSSSAAEDSKIAIIGYSGRFPDADGVSEFWDLLSQGLDVHKPVPHDRFDWKTHQDSTLKRKNTSRVSSGCWIREPGLFDARFFHMSPREACQTDPAHRLALLTAYEALEMAGVVPDRTPSTRRHRVGVFYGTTSDDWREVNSGQDIDTYFIPGSNRAFVPGRVNYFFKFSGPSISVDTACSSSLTAINIACRSLLNRDCDTAVAGGTNVMTNPDNFAGLDRGHFLCPSGNCKTFDDGADGYCRGDGVGSVVLKRLSDAVKDNDPVFGVILGAQTNHSAEAVSITRPLADAQERLFKKMLNESGVKPHDVSYIEMHGTGTQAGDAVEMQSVLNTFAWDHSRTKELHLGSVKANVGHGESAAGVTALIKVLLMMRNDRIPPHVGIKTRINRHFPHDLAHRGVRIAVDGADWSHRGDGKRLAFVNNFSAAGGNSALLIEDAPLHKDVEDDARGSHVIVVSARSEASLRRNIQHLAESIDSSSHSLAQVSYTTTARRMHHPLRVSVVASDLQQLKDRLHQAGAQPFTRIPARKRTVGFLFTGQGGQYTAMGRGLYEHFPSFARDVDDLTAVAASQDLPSILPLVLDEPIEQLSATVVQLGTCILQMAIARFWQNLGVVPSYVVGHSLGEYAALHVAGVLAAHDAIYLCGKRAQLLEAKCTPGTHGMVAVRAPRAALLHLVSDVEVACVNGPEDTVLSGGHDAINAACERLTQSGLRFTKLVLPFAFHSSQVDPLLDDLEHLATGVRFKAPSIPVVSALLARVVDTDGVFGPAYLRRHCRDTVNFQGAIQAAQQAGLVDTCVEIGTHPILCGMLKAIAPDAIRCHTLKHGKDTFATLADALSSLYLAGVPISWDEYHRWFPCQKVIPLPSYAWEYQNYWIQYEHDWCLTKGDAPSKATSLRLSSSVHEVIEQVLREDGAYIIAQSDVHDPELLPVANAHAVSGVRLCPSGLYADVAYTLAQHLVKLKYPEDHLVPDICNMQVDKGLAVSTGPQLFRAALTLDWTTRKGSMDLYSVDENGKRTVPHAHCEVHLANPQSWGDEWHRQHHFVHRSVDCLLRGPAHRIGRSIAYKLFSAAVEYGTEYRGMQEVVFDSQALESTAVVRLQPVKGEYLLNPYWCDSLGHITGFTMNTQDDADDDVVYINHGWSHMRLAEPLDADATYRTYVKMQPLREDLSSYSGDVYVLREGKIVASYGGVTFNRVPRRILEMVLGKMSPATSPAKPPPKMTVEANTTVVAPVSTVRQALNIIAGETGVATKDLADDAQFADLGVDSLLSLTIVGILRESLLLDVPSSLFDDYPSVRALKAFLSASEEIEDSDQSAVSSPTSFFDMDTPATEIDEIMPPVSVDMVMQLLAHEVGVPPETIPKTVDLAELGVDSLVSLTLVSSVQEKLQVELPHDTFLKHTSVSDLRAALSDILPRPSIPPATSVLLQGSGPQTLFFFAEGSGSSTPYAAIPRISPMLRVYGLNCPYLRTPDRFQCSLQELTPTYIAEIRRRQPHGPYSLAGWSAGGIAAYDAARALIAQGEVVEHLILVDSPNPLGVEKFPPSFYTFLEKAGVFGIDGGKSAPEWLFPHIMAFMDALDKWVPAPVTPTPPTTIIWAKDGVCKDANITRPNQESCTKEMAWMLDDRADLGPNGWDTLLGENISIECVGGANHFSMMKAPMVDEVADIIRKTMAQ